MKLKALWTSKINLLQAVCLITNKNTHSTGAINIDQSGRFLGGGIPVRFLLNGKKCRNEVYTILRVG